MLVGQLEVLWYGCVHVSMINLKVKVDFLT